MSIYGSKALRSLLVSEKVSAEIDSNISWHWEKLLQYLCTLPPRHCNQVLPFRPTGTYKHPPLAHRSSKRILCMDRYPRHFDQPFRLSNRVATTRGEFFFVCIFAMIHTGNVSDNGLLIDKKQLPSKNIFFLFSNFSLFPFFHQLFIDYNLYGMNLINVGAVKFRRKRKTSEGDEDNDEEDKESGEGSQGSRGSYGTLSFMKTPSSQTVSNTPCAKKWDMEDMPR